MLLFQVHPCMYLFSCAVAGLAPPVLMIPIRILSAPSPGVCPEKPGIAGLLLFCTQPVQLQPDAQKAGADELRHAFFPVDSNPDLTFGPRANTRFFCAFDRPF